MSSGNYATYLGYKSFQEKIKGLYVCKSGDTMTGDLNMSCNDITNVSIISACENGALQIQTNGTNVFIIDTSGNISMPNLPISSTGLSSGTIWRNGGVLNIVT